MGEKEDLVDSKFEKMDDQDDIHTTYRKLYKLFEKHEKLYRLATKKLEAELFQVRAQLERTSSAKLDEMLSIQKSASDHTCLGYEFSSSNNTSTSITVFVPLSNIVEIENNNVKIDLASGNLDKGKSILGASPKLEKKNTKNPKAKKATSQKPNKRSNISVIIVVLPVILDRIAISG